MCFVIFFYLHMFLLFKYSYNIVFLYANTITDTLVNCPYNNYYTGSDLLLICTVEFNEYD